MRSEVRKEGSGTKRLRLQQNLKGFDKTNFGVFFYFWITLNQKSFQGVEGSLHALQHWLQDGTLTEVMG